MPRSAWIPLSIAACVVLVGLLHQHEASSQGTQLDTGGPPPAKVDLSYLPEWQQEILSHVQIYARLLRGNDLLVLDSMIAGCSVPIPNVPLSQFAREVYLVLRISTPGGMNRRLRSLTLQLTSPKLVARIEVDLAVTLHAPGGVYSVTQVVSTDRMLPGDTPSKGDAGVPADTRESLIDVIPEFRAIRMSVD